jgi:signal transduction histidine kinase
MNRVEAGDLTARVPEDAPDELGRLGRNFNAMVARLADARRQLEDRHAEQIRRAQSLASLGQMAAGIAHEINNPIAGMQNCVRTLLKGTRDEAKRAQYLEMLREGLDRIGRTVGHLLNFARESKPQLTQTNLPPLLQRCLVLLEHDLAARRVSFTLAVDGKLPVFLADPHQLEQVFLNVLKNALEAMPVGGKLTVSAGLRQRETGPFVEVRVADTGGGIHPENLPRIFDPFFTTKDVGKGTGLGLSVSYGIVRAHGGFIDVDTEVGTGTTVSIALPLNGG